MKSKDLMIGDWVCLKYTNEYGSVDEYVRINGILAKGCAAQYGDGTIWGEGHGNLGNGDVLYPIPLTPEILEKNGFKNKPTYSVYHSEDDRTEITIYYNSGVDIIKNNYLEGEETFSLPFLYLCYVHEFQHALRLCGLKDMADNFKIE